MLEITVQYLTGRQRLRIYHRSDLNDEDIANDPPTHEDVGKYYHFKDGSNWCAKILVILPRFFRTTIGLHRREDIVIQSTVKYPDTQYSGVYRSDESFILAKQTKSEIHKVNNIMLTGEVPYRTTARLRMMILERIQEQCNLKGIDEEYIVKKLFEEAENAKNRGIERIEAIKILARLNNIETEKQDPRFVTNNNAFISFGGGSVQEQRRGEIPINSHLKAAIGLLKERERPEEAEKLLNSPHMSYNAIDRPLFSKTGQPINKKDTAEDIVEAEYTEIELEKVNESS